MSRPAADPDRPNNARLTTKVPRPDAEGVIELAEQAGITRSEFLRQVVLEALEREDS